MDIVVARLVFASLVGVLVGLIGLPLKRFRRRAAALAALSTVAFLGFFAVFTYKSNDWARQAGYENVADMNAARAAGVLDAAEWAKRKAQ